MADAFHSLRINRKKTGTIKVTAPKRKVLLSTAEKTYVSP